MPNQVRIGVGMTGVGKASSEVDGLKDKFIKLRDTSGKGLAIGAGAAVAVKGIELVGSAISGVIDIGNTAIKNASDLREATSLTGQVFEKNAGQIGDWAGTAARAFGESKAEAMSFAAEFGTAFKNVGYSLDETTAKAETMTRLAADLGSAFNKSSAEAATALRSGLLGESEPLRAFGVFLDEAKVKAQAAAMGMKPLNGALTDGQKVAARYALIMKQTADSQGMFGRDTDSLADSQKRAEAEMTNESAILGQKLLPAMVALTRFVSGTVIPAISFLADHLGEVATVAAGLGIAFVATKLGLVAVAVETTLAGGGFMALAAAEAAALWPLAALAAAIGLVALVTSDSTTKVDSAGSKWGRYGKAAKDAAGDTGKAADDIVVAMTGIENHAGKMADDVTRANRDAGKSFKTMAFDAKNASADMLTVATKTVNDYYDVLIAKDDLLATNTEINALRKIAAGRKLTKEEQANLHRLERTQAQLEADLASHGATQGKEFTSTMNTLLKRLKTAHGAEKAAIQAEIRQLQLLAVSAAIANGKVLTLQQSITATLAKGGYINAAGSTPHRAAGGPVSAGHPYIVGENHPEVFVPDQSGTIIPHAPSAITGGMGGGGPIVIQTTINGNPSPGQIQAWAREAAPALARELQRQRLLPVG